MEQDKPSEPKKKRSVIGILAVFLLCLFGIVYAVNGYNNVTAADEIKLYCDVEDQRLAEMIQAGSEGQNSMLDWMVNLHRARRRYVRDLCAETIIKLDWWRFNMIRPVEADVSEQTQQDIQKTLTRAASSCESEVRDLEKAFERELNRSSAEPIIRGKVRTFLKGRMDSCIEFRELQKSSRPAYWPPLKARTPAQAPQALRNIMPDSLLESEEGQ